MTKVCRVCGEEKDAEDFYAGQGRTCKSCTKSRARDWRGANPLRYRATRRAWEKDNVDLAVKRRVNRLRRRYKLSRSQVEERLKKQNHLCLICKVKLHSPFDPNPSPDTTKPVVDHDHRDGHVRGILCSACNVALGLLEDSTKTIAAAYRYLKNDQANSALR